MVKNKQMLRKNSFIGGHRQTIMVGVIVLLALFLIPLVSSFDFDNVKDYNPLTKEVTINNAFGLPLIGDIIAKVQLIENTEYCLTECSALLKIEGFNINYKNILSELNFKDINNKDTSINSFKYEWVNIEEYEVDVNDYKKGESYIALNGSQTYDTTLVGTHKETRTREVKVKDYSTDDTLTGVSYLRIYGYKNSQQSVDWIPTLYGVKVNEWAWWSSVSPLIYWALNETSGNANDSSDYGRNATNINGIGYTGGKFGNALWNLNNTAYLNLSAPTDDVPQLAQQPFTIIVWANRTQGIPATINKNFLTQGEAGALSCSGWTFGLRGAATSQGNLIRFESRNGTIGGVNQLYTTNTTANYTDSKWHMFVATRNSAGNLTIYVDNINMGSKINNDNLTYSASLGGCATVGNGIKVGGGAYSVGEFWNGTLDDIGIYNLSITESDINALWNNGTGKTQVEYEIPTEITLSVSLDKPSDNTNVILSQMSFNSSASALNANSFSNATLHLWYANTTLIATNFTTSLSTNTTNLSLSGIPLGILHWNTEYCAVNATGSKCNFAPNNFTLNVNSFTENNQSFNNSVKESTIQSFLINITYDTAKFNLITGSLDYNGTYYPGIGVSDGTNTIFTRSIAIPEVDVTQNKTFQWMFTLTGTGGSIQSNSTKKQQTINAINASILGFPYTIPFINFTVYDEKTLAQINVTMSATLNYGITTTNKNLSYSEPNSLYNSFVFSFYPTDGTYLVGGNLYYTKSGWSDRTYILREQSFTNVTTKIKLYLLNSSDSTTFTVYVRDSSFSSVAEASVYIQRYYPGTGEWITVEVVETNYDGKTLGHFKTEDINYRFLVYVDGELKLTSTSTKIICESLPCTITLTLPGDISYSTIRNLTDFSYDLSYSKLTETFTYSYIDSSSDSIGGRLQVLKSSWGNSTIQQICNVTSTASTAVLTCDISSYSNGTYIATAYNDRTGELNTIVSRLVISKVKDIVNQIGLDGVIWGFFLILGIVMLGLIKPSVAIVFGLVGLVLVSWIGIISIPILSISAVVFIGIILLWEMRR